MCARSDGRGPSQPVGVFATSQQLQGLLPALGPGTGAEHCTHSHGIRFGDQLQQFQGHGPPWITMLPKVSFQWIANLKFQQIAKQLLSPTFLIYCLGFCITIIQAVQCGCSMLLFQGNLPVRTISLLVYNPQIEALPGQSPHKSSNFRDL